MAFPTSPTEGQIYNKYKFSNGMWDVYDDTEEVGTWTPQLKGTAGAATMGGANSGWYTRQGNMVTVGGSCSWTSSNVSGNITIAGLPYPARSSANGGDRSSSAYGAITAGAMNLSTDCIGVINVIDPGHSDMYIIEQKLNEYKHSVSINNTGTIYGITMTYLI